MLGWLYRIIVGKFTLCEHKWKTVSENKIHRNGDELIMASGIVYVLECEKCGDIKSVKVKP